MDAKTREQKNKAAIKSIVSYESGATDGYIVAAHALARASCQDHEPLNRIADALCGLLAIELVKYNDWDHTR